jgi:hypothetical protein
LGEMKRPRKSRGAPPKNVARAHYDQLMKQGMGNSEACRIVGISRSSGTRWRHGHTVVLKSGDIKKYAPISHQRPAAISTRFSLRVGTDHDRGPVARPAQHPCHCHRARAESVDREQGDPPQYSRAVWQLPAEDGSAQCRAEKESSAAREDRQQP